MQVAVLQSTSRIGDVQGNLARLRSAAMDAGTRGATVLVTPELYATGYDPAQVHGTDGAEIRKQAAELAVEAGISLVISTVEHVRRERYISAHLFGPTGEVTAAYRKTHLFGGEAAHFTAGPALPTVVPCHGVPVALGLCYDVEFPEFVRAVAERGAALLLAPTAVPLRQPSPDGVHFDASTVPRILVPARAVENGLSIAYANHTRPAFAGHSCVATPSGLVAADAEEDVVLLAQVPVSAAKARAANPYLASRRRDLY